MNRTSNNRKRRRAIARRASRRSMLSGLQMLMNAQRQMERAFLEALTSGQGIYCVGLQPAGRTVLK